MNAVMSWHAAWLLGSGLMGGGTATSILKRSTASYNESLIPFRALFLHARITGSEVSLKAAQRRR